MADASYEDDDLFADIYADVEEPVASKPEAQPAPAAAAATAATTTTTTAQQEPEHERDETSQATVVTSTAQPPADSESDVNVRYDYDGSDTGTDSAPAARPFVQKDDGKMFIGGLNWETTDESLKAYFSQFGEVIECTVMRDGATGRSRGFGFLTFKDPKNVNTVMVKEHMLDGKLIDPKRAIPRDEQERTAKIFVGGVSQECDQETFKNYFKQFGNVLDATLMMDKNTNRPRGFGFVTFDNDAAVDRTLEQPLSICNKYIEIKRAQPRGDMREQDPRGLNKLNKNGGGPLFNRAGSTAGAGGQQMSPAMMAAYWQRMQQYFQMMQQQMTANSMGGMGAMHPAMMQQMMARQGMMQQMMGGQPSSSTGDGSPMHPGSPSQEGQHQGQDMGGMNMGMGGIGMGMGMGNSSSWEGMYDDVPAPGHMRGGYGAGQRGGGATGTPPSAAGTPQAPANAPTGPRNAGRPGANYRGGGRGGHRGFHPYARGA